jgi:hypothetical protein
MRRYYVVEDKLIEREEGSDTVLIYLSDERLPMRNLAVEGLVTLLVRGASMSDILTGAVIPKRAPPHSATKSSREPTLLMQAIAAVVAADLTDRARKDGLKVDKAAIGTEALETAQKMTPEQVKQAGKLTSVRIALARIQGLSGSVRDLI